MPGDEEAGLTDSGRGGADAEEATTDEDSMGGSEDRLGTRHEPGDHSDPTGQEPGEGAGDTGTDQDDSSGQERDEQESGAAESTDEEESEDGDDADRGLTDEARSRGGTNSSQAQERDEHGRFVGKD